MSEWMRRQQWERDRRNNYIHFATNPRCNCEECDGNYRVHNEYRQCDCSGCVQQRERIVSEARNRLSGENGRGTGKMSTINFCDRCESMGKSEAMGVISIIPNREMGPEEIEICPGCVTDFMTWRNEDAMTDRQRAYKEPWRPESDVEESGDIILTKEQAKKMLKALESGE